MSLFATQSSPHDAALLIKQWQQLAKKCRMSVTVLHTTQSGLPVLGLATANAAPALYLSAGVHGDEAAPPWALLAWAYHHVELLKTGSYLICPCVNPDGLRANTRVDEAGRDLNRSFHNTKLPLMRRWQQFVKGRPLRLAVCLHEDYDARGCYMYALGMKREPELLMREVEGVIARDGRSTIDGSRAKMGLIQRKRPPAGIAGPEALIICEDLGCPASLTFETPSEFDLDERLEAHQALLTAVASLMA
jgi:murein peptide amidase A